MDSPTDLPPEKLEPWQAFHLAAAIAGWRKSPGFLCTPTLVSPQYWLLKARSEHRAQRIVQAFRYHWGDRGDPHFGFLRVDGFNEEDRLEIGASIRRGRAGEVPGIDSKNVQKAVEEAPRIDADLDGLLGTATRGGTATELLLPAGTFSECYVFVRRYPLLLRPFPFEEFDPLPCDEAHEAMIAYASRWRRENAEGIEQWKRQRRKRCLLSAEKEGPDSLKRLFEEERIEALNRYWKQEVERGAAADASAATRVLAEALDAVSQWEEGFVCAGPPRERREVGTAFFHGWERLGKQFCPSEKVRSVVSLFQQANDPLGDAIGKVFQGFLDGFGANLRDTDYEIETRFSKPLRCDLLAYLAFLNEVWANLQDSDDTEQEEARPKWYHEAHEEPPLEFKERVLRGTKKDLSICLGDSPGTSNPRRLEGEGRKEHTVWVRRQHGQTFEAFFPTQDAFARANAKMIGLQRKESGVTWIGDKPKTT